jgi:hypothetical protein
VSHHPSSLATVATPDLADGDTGVSNKDNTPKNVIVDADSGGIARGEQA